MFAYCNNNPIRFIDPTGHAPSMFVTCLEAGSDGFAYITDQEADNVKNKKIGFSKVGKAGCGPVAIYNALVSLGNPQSFNDILRYYNSHSFQMNAFGLLGMNPSTVARYFERHGYTVKMTTSKSKMDSYSQTADACIMWYAYTCKSFPWIGAHFVEYSRVADGYIARNNGGSNGLYPFAIPSDFAYETTNFYAVGIYIYK